MLAIVRPGALRARLARRRSATAPVEPDLESLASIVPAAVIEELGLAVAETAVREYGWWRRPQRILVTEASERKLSWLRGVAPDVELVTARNERDAIAGAAGADGIIGWCTPAMLAAGRQLRWLQIDTAGVDAIRHLGELPRRGILVTNLQRVAAPVIAEHALALLLSLTRGLHRYRHSQRRALWRTHPESADPLTSLRGKQLLVAGLGGIGCEVARLAHLFGMHVDAMRASSRKAPEYVKRVEGPEALHRLVSHADVVINTLPLTPATRGIFDRSVFRAAKRGALFVNVARGASVVTGDLVEALRSGELGGAGLDVTDPEPLPKWHPLWRMPNVVITPHIAGRSRATLEREWIVLKENLRRYVAGEPLLSVVDLARAY